jgi:branched-chain amino acid transport system substrate-binding protein
VRHTEFVSNYHKRFNTKPSFSVKFGYEAMTLLSSAISKSSESNSLKDSLIKLGPIQGLQDSLELDRYGDIQRSVYVMKFKENEFRVVAKGDGSKFILI